jgi:hypothetical protein
MSELHGPPAPAPATTTKTTTTTTTTEPTTACRASECESPPPSPAPARETAGDDLASQLRRMAQQLMRTQNRRLVVEYLQLRRALR